MAWKRVGMGWTLLIYSSLCNLTTNTTLIFVIKNFVKVKVNV